MEFSGDTNMNRVPWQANNKLPNTIDERIAREAYKEYSAQGHGAQSFERIHERGGFSLGEIIALLFTRCRRLECNIEYEFSNRQARYLMSEAFKGLREK